jgi:hypothetical protein
MMYDCAGIAESLFTNMIILSHSFLLIGFAKRRAVFFALASLSIASVILVRPAGLYFFLTWTMVLCYLAWNKYSRADMLSFFTPFSFLLLALCSYNKITIDHFTLTPFGELNLVGATALYWESDPALPPEINDALKDLPNTLAKAHFGTEQKTILQESWDPHLLFPVFANSYNILIHDGWGLGQKFGTTDYLQNRSNIRKLSFLAIRKHPDIYAKYIYTNLFYHFYAIGFRFDFYAAISPMAKQHYLGVNRAYSPAAAKEYLNATPPATVRIVGDLGHQIVEIPMTNLRLIHELWQSAHRKIFHNRLWLVPYFGVLILSIVQLVRHRGHHLGSFLLLVLTISAIAAASLVSLVEPSLERYSYPTQFTYYLCLVLVPFLGMKTHIAIDPKTPVSLSPQPR